MYIRSVKTRSSSGQIHEYIRIVESVREGGRVRQKPVANLGRRDVLESVLPMLTRFLQGEPEAKDQLESEDAPVQPLEACTWGPVLVARALFDQLDLWQILDACQSSSPRRHRRGQGQIPEDWVSRVLALVANRLSDPCSEHRLASWLESFFVCDRDGRRYVPAWEDRGRVQVAFDQLQRWYRTHDKLLAHKEWIEHALYQRLCDLFSMKPDLVFYDLTSAYFEGLGPEDAKRGHSRDEKPRNPQVVVGVVMVGGWPITHHVWEGNRRDSTTFLEVVNDLSERFEFNQVVFVGDRGMVTERNLRDLRAKGEPDGSLGYLLGMTRRGNPEAERLIDRIDPDQWLECDGGINAQEKGPNAPQTWVQEVRSDRPGVRVFVVDSEERRAYEQRMREKVMERARADLDRVVRRVQAGSLKRPEKIGAAVTRALQRHHGHRYFDWRVRNGALEYFEHPVNLPREKKYEGKYLIQTDQSWITAQQAVAEYKQLNEVERGFRTLKHPLGMRPFFHKRSDRVRAHVFVSALALLLDRLLERRLKEANVGMSSTEAWSVLETIRWVSFETNGERRSGVTAGSRRAQRVLEALGLTDRRPPTPPERPEATVC